MAIHQPDDQILDSIWMTGIRKQHGESGLIGTACKRQSRFSKPLMPQTATLANSLHKYVPPAGLADVR